MTGERNQHSENSRAWSCGKKQAGTERDKHQMAQLEPHPGHNFPRTCANKYALEVFVCLFCLS